MGSCVLSTISEPVTFIMKSPSSTWRCCFFFTDTEIKVQNASVLPNQNFSSLLSLESGKIVVYPHGKDHQQGPLALNTFIFVERTRLWTEIK